ncbi:ABC transporter substrate-binding protein [Paenibacillus sp. KR2-11]|uniref:ABC transporter substrate-binding protein n=1 Tax=Paenibacillus sp. KR2-11 TaxID=3385500 RepID=UPI0038FC9400
MKTKPALILSILSLLALSACGSPAASPAATNPQPQATAGQPAAAEPRIASLSIHLTNNLLALGITPVGSVLGGKAKDFLPHVADRLQNTKKLGVAAEPDMEALLALKPETIYADEAFAGKDISSYKSIAPTEVISLDQGTWRDHLKTIGKNVHREAQADAFIADYAKQAEKVKGLIAKKLAGGTAMAIRVSAKELRVMGMARPLGPLLFQDLGLKPAQGVEKITKAYETVSQEVLPDYNPDAIFVIVNVEDDAKKVFEQLQANPLWQGLKAVKAGQVYLIPEQPWLDYSALGSKMALDEAEKLFSK